MKERSVSMAIIIRHILISSSFYIVFFISVICFAQQYTGDDVMVEAKPKIDAAYDAYESGGGVDKDVLRSGQVGMSIAKGLDMLMTLNNKLKDEYLMELFKEADHKLQRAASLYLNEGPIETVSYLYNEARIPLEIVRMYQFTIELEQEGIKQLFTERDLLRLKAFKSEVGRAYTAYRSEYKTAAESSVWDAQKEEDFVKIAARSAIILKTVYDDQKVGAKKIGSATEIGRRIEFLNAAKEAIDVGSVRRADQHLKEAEENLKASMNKSESSPKEASNISDSKAKTFTEKLVDMLNNILK